MENNYKENYEKNYITKQLDKGSQAVATKEGALEWLGDYLKMIIDNENEDWDDKVEEIKETLSDIDSLKKNHMEWVLIEECPMAGNNICLKKLVLG